MSQIPLGTQFIGLASTYQTTERRSALINNESQPYTMQDIIDTVGGRLEGTQYVFVAADGTDVQNAAELQAAYVTAQGMSPSITNRITVIAAPGSYNFSTANFEMDTDYIDLVSLDGNKSIVFNGSNTIEITANDVFVRGVDVGTLNFIIANSLNLLRVENCTGGEESFGGGGTASGTFNSCTGGIRAFGGQNTASGTFTDCSGGKESFGGNGGDASGVFNSCTGGDYSFGGGGTLSGFLYYCRLTSGTFETVSGFGRTVLCIDGNNAQNNQ